ncbi:MAG TPA: DNA-binding domain-containing protein [Steroidobacteraceae bacterium]|nr:DNA-binding domain-containing protein [Steroidobacteraceae bacterium]
MKLAQLQRSFQAHVLRGDPAIGSEVAGDPRFAVPLRLGVYTEAYAARLIEVLGESFPATQAALGGQSFARLAGEFVREHPSRCRSARDYGAQLPRWLASRLRGPRGRGLGDLAQFEWAVAGAFDAADDPALAHASVAGIAPAQWPGLRFGFSPSLRRLSVASNCVAWWRFACAGQPRPGRWRSTRTQRWLVWRRDLAVFYRRLSQSEAQALDAAIAGESFGYWCAKLPTPLAAAGMLHRWFSDGLVTAARLEGQRR